MKSKKQLEIALQKLRPIEQPKNTLEQYPTDASTAAHVLTLAYNDGNILGKSVVDLGTGNGIFAIGAKMLGASRVVGVETDPDQVEIAKLNCEGTDVEILLGDISQIQEKFDTAIMNPPFGSVKEHADLPFIRKAAEIASNIYAIHNAKSYEFLKGLYSTVGEIVYEEYINLEIPRLYAHHTKERATVKSVLFVVRVKDAGKS